MGWSTGLEPATTRTTIWSSTIELRPPTILEFRYSQRLCKGKGWRCGTFSAYSSPVVEAGIEPAGGRTMISPRDRMKKIGSIMLAGLFVFLCPGKLPAQADDPSEIFLKAYMTAQQGEKLEHENQFKAALAKYRFAGSLLEQLRKTHADWQPAIVEYRSRKVSENILRVQGKVSTQEDLTTGPTSLPEGAAILPDQPGPPEPSVEITPQR